MREKVKIDWVPLEKVYFPTPTGLSPWELDFYIRTEVEKLPEMEKKVIREIFYEDKSLKEIANEVGVSIKSIFRIKTKALNRIKRSLSFR